MMVIAINMSIKTKHDLNEINVQFVSPDLILIDIGMTCLVCDVSHF